MINHNEHTKELSLENKDIKVILGYENGVVLKDWIHKNSTRVNSNYSRNIFNLYIEGNIIPSSNFEIIELVKDADNCQELISFLVCAKFEENNELTCRFSLVSNIDNSIDIFLQVKALWHEDIPREVELDVPFLSDFPQVESGENVIWLPSNPKHRPDGSSLFRLHGESIMPLGIVDSQEKNGYSITFPSAFPPIQNCNPQIYQIGSIDGLKKLKLFIKPHKELGDIVVAKVTAINNGWIEFFDKWRSNIRKTINLNQYIEPQNQWYKKTYMHHFTYIFGKEVFNYETNSIEIERLLEQGEEFGGYDAVILWHQYPRLGIDERSQWDFYNDFPGGREGLKSIVKNIQSYGVRVFLPFKPWDIKSEQSLDEAAQELASLVEDTDIDGFFLDTMSNVPKTFKQAIDKIKKGVVFCSEGQPDGKNSLEIITGSWEQQFTGFVDCNLLRFALPEHYGPMISRWVVGIRKDILIKRAIFNGTGLVIWQDIFGAWLPYSKPQKEKIKKWKDILATNHDTFFGSNPIPLYPTLKDGLYCNCFTSNDDKSLIYCLYNDTDKYINGELFVHMNGRLINAEECWHGKDVTLVEHDGYKTISSEVDSGDVAVVKFSIN